MVRKDDHISHELGPSLVRLEQEMGSYCNFKNYQGLAYISQQTDF